MSSAGRGADKSPKVISSMRIWIPPFTRFGNIEFELKWQSMRVRWERHNPRYPEFWGVQMSQVAVISSIGIRASWEVTLLNIRRRRASVRAIRKLRGSWQSWTTPRLGNQTSTYSHDLLHLCKYRDACSKFSSKILLTDAICYHPSQFKPWHLSALSRESQLTRCINFRLWTPVITLSYIAIVQNSNRSLVRYKIF